jgi:hypothetical protein
MVWWLSVVGVNLWVAAVCVAKCCLMVNDLMVLMAIEFAKYVSL